MQQFLQITLLINNHFCKWIALYNIEILFQSTKMRYLFLIVSIGLLSFQNKANTTLKGTDTLRLKPRNLNYKASDTIVITGAELTKLYLPLIKGKTIALVVNQTSVIGKTHLVDSLISLGIKVKTIFAPEHGFRGDHSAGAKVNSAIDPKTGIK